MARVPKYSSRCERVGVRSAFGSDMERRTSGATPEYQTPRPFENERGAGDHLCEREGSHAEVSS